jgi:glutathione-regulated potassium-efflux system ancillary protein KefF
MSAQILVLAAHPALAHSRVNQRLLKVLREQAQAAPERLVVHDLYARYPDYVIDVAAEQTAARQAQLHLWLHPIHWYGMPPLMKLWLDEVLSFGWAYGPGGEALRGKTVWPVLSTGGPQESYQPSSYNRYAFDAFLPAYEQTAALCGMRMLPPLVLHGAHRVDEAALAAHASLLAQRVATWPAWDEPAAMAQTTCDEIPADARPVRGA